MINYVLTLTLSALGISDVHLMLHFSHVNIVIALIMTIYLMIRGIRNNKLDKGFVYTVIIAMTFAATGGDEFIVIANCNDITVVEDALDKIDECAKQYNAEISPPVSLQIAYGYAEFDHHKGSLEAAEHLADKRMYEKKRQMRAFA